MTMKRLIVLLAVAAVSLVPGVVAVPEAGPPGDAPDYCVVLHGLGRTSLSMRRMARSLRSNGYDVVNIGYPSTRDDVAGLVERLSAELERHCTNDAARVHFVGHSLGGMLARCFLARNPEFPVGRVVMLSPPNRGSEVADKMREWWPYQAATGPMGQRLGTSSNDLPQQLPPVTYDVGIITGDRSLNPLYSAWVDGVDDGKVSIERARLPGMRDFLVVHASHTFIMRRREVIDQVMHFLKNGIFKRAGSTDSEE
jgi:pimeloyl-ACP methyl ester carboxylesterase